MTNALRHVPRCHSRNVGPEPLIEGLVALVEQEGLNITTTIATAISTNFCRHAGAGRFRKHRGRMVGAVRIAPSALNAITKGKAGGRN